MEKIIDLRSDNVTVPDDEMRIAMQKAVVGDDILGEDPTVRQLEELAASILGYEAGLFVISGTMANQIAVMTLTQRGQEIIVGEESHIYNLEVGALATLSQVQVRPVPVRQGIYDVEKIERSIQSEEVQKATTGLICIEDTYDLTEGWPVPLENIKDIKSIARKYGIPVYLDGARLFNAAVYLDISPAEICKCADVTQICLTKGLGAPLGSVLVGNKNFIKEARRIRQRIGGGMRQAGVIAAPGIVALKKNINRLQIDHKNALKLARGLSAIPGLYIETDNVCTNILSPIIEKDGWDADKLITELSNFHIKVKKLSFRSFRMITHLQISEQDIVQIIHAFKKILED
jgi:threonine aldolase